MISSLSVATAIAIAPSAYPPVELNHNLTKSVQMVASVHAIIDVINDVRRKGATCGEDRFEPQRPIRMDYRLNLSAGVHSSSMALYGFFGHVDIYGKRADSRIELYGYYPKHWGEVLAKTNQFSPKHVVDLWLASYTHCIQLLRPSYKHVGVGIAYIPITGEYIVTVNFGAER